MESPKKLLLTVVLLLSLGGCASVDKPKIPNYFFIDARGDIVTLGAHKPYLQTDPTIRTAPRDMASLMNLTK